MNQQSHNMLQTYLPAGRAYIEFLDVVHLLTDSVQQIGVGKYDPFSTYPELPYASDGIDKLVSFCKYNIL